MGHVGNGVVIGPEVVVGAGVVVGFEVVLGGGVVVGSGVVESSVVLGGLVVSEGVICVGLVVEESEKKKHCSPVSVTHFALMSSGFAQTFPTKRFFNRRDTCQKKTW